MVGRGVPQDAMGKYKAAYDSALPAQQKVQLTYSYGLHGALAVITTDFGGKSTYRATFRGNGLFDPDQKGAGHQPMGFDQWAAFYQEYYVISCEAAFYVENAASGQGPCQAIIIPSTASTSPFAGRGIDTVYELYYSLPKTHRPRVKSQALLTSTGGANGWPKMLKGKWYTKDMLPFSKEDAEAAVTSDPLDQWYVHMLVNFPQSIADCNINVYMVLKYDVVFKTPHMLPSS